MCLLHYSRMKKYGTTEIPDVICVICEMPFHSPSNRARLCSSCRKVDAAAKSKEWFAGRPGYGRDKQRERRARVPEQMAAYQAKYRLDNLEHILQNYALWNAANPKHTTDWCRRNPQRALETSRRRRARLVGAETFSVSARDIAKLMARFQHSCAYCRVALGSACHIDHVVPLARGGSNGIGNLVPACPSCNLSKNSRLLSYWRYKSTTGQAAFLKASLL